MNIVHIALTPEQEQELQWMADALDKAPRGTSTIAQVLWLQNGPVLVVRLITAAARNPIHQIMLDPNSEYKT